MLDLYSQPSFGSGALICGIIKLVDDVEDGGGGGGGAAELLLLYSSLWSFNPNGGAPGPASLVWRRT